MKRSRTSHKGDNGVVAVVGGSSRYHGAPLFSALAAEASGVDLLHLWIPAVHHEVAKSMSLNFQVHPFGSAKADELSGRDIARIVEMLATIDAAVIGPGLSRSPASIRMIMALLEEAPCPIVVDASALQPGTLKAVSGRHAVLTPHLGELERMGIAKSDLSNVCKEHVCTILLKTEMSLIVSESGEETEVSGGNPGLTVGGTGDTLAGLTAGLIAQGLPHGEACVIASKVVKTAADELLKTKGFAFTTIEVIDALAATLSKVSPPEIT